MQEVPVLRVPVPALLVAEGCALVHLETLHAQAQTLSGRLSGTKAADTSSWGVRAP